MLSYKMLYHCLSPAHLNSFIEPPVGGVVARAGAVHGTQHGVGVGVCVGPVPACLVQAQNAQRAGDQLQVHSVHLI